MLDIQQEIGSPTNSHVTNEAPRTKDASVQVNTLDDMLPLRLSIFAGMMKCDKYINTWTGIPSFQVLEKIQRCVEQVYSRVHGFLPPLESTYRMSLDEKVALCFVKLKTNLSFDCISHLFQIKACTASRVFTTVIPLIRIAVQCNIYFPSVEEIRSNLPKIFREHFPIVRGVLDCTEIRTQLPKCLNCKISSFLGYKQTNTTQFLICMTPAGTISYVSSGYSGKSSDKFIFNNEKLIEKFEVGDAIMVDKGFFYRRGNSSKWNTFYSTNIFLISYYTV